MQRGQDLFSAAGFGYTNLELRDTITWCWLSCRMDPQVRGAQRGQPLADPQPELGFILYVLPRSLQTRGEPEISSRQGWE